MSVIFFEDIIWLFERSVIDKVETRDSNICYTTNKVAREYETSSILSRKFEKYLEIRNNVACSLNTARAYRDCLPAAAATAVY